MVIPYDEDHFTVSMDVEVSLQFLAWVIGLGSGAKVISPVSEVERMKVEAKRLMEQYN